jgi:hypothetical protein
MDPDTFLLSLDFLIEIGGQAIAIGNQAFQDRDAPLKVGDLAFHCGRPTDHSVSSFCLHLQPVWRVNWPTDT